MTRHDPGFRFDNSYARDLEGFYVPWKGAAVSAPKVLRLNRPLAAELGLDAEALDSAAGAAILSGAASPEGASPLAMAYAGHQFGGFSPQLGDGRALLVGELIDDAGLRRDLHLKGSGRTPFSRGADGKAALGPVLREYLIGEAMHAQGIPTTRALAAVTTGDEIERDTAQPGAVLARVAASHLRVGTFQFFAARGEDEKVRQLADYAIARHYPSIGDGPDRYLALLCRVRDAQAALIARWMGVGFVHGVMNTDNMTISGETIDYGPCAFLDIYDPDAVFSSIDRDGRYAYGNQPSIAQWNLARLAETLLGLIAPGDSAAAVRLATHEIKAFEQIYQTAWTNVMRRKLGLTVEHAEDFNLATDLLVAMAGQSVDFTGFFRALSDIARCDASAPRGYFLNPLAFDPWLERYLSRVATEKASLPARAAQMDAANPIYIPRNHQVENALSAAGNGDMAPFDRLLAAITDPYTSRVDLNDLAQPAPASFGPYTTYCGT